MRLIIYGLAGAVVGFIGMYSVLSYQLDFDFGVIAFPVNLFITSITVLLVLYASTSMVQMRRKAKRTAVGAEEDKLEIWLYKRLSDTNMASIASVVLGIAAIAISLITTQETWLMLLSAFVTAIAFLLSLAVPALFKSLYPERQLPSVSDKNYGIKLLAASDEGERHVMLEGLYRSFNTLNSALIFVLLLLIGYSIYTSVSQLFAILVIGVVLIGANTQYFLFIRNKS